MTDTHYKNTAVRDILENALVVYDTPEECKDIALAFIDGLKAGARRSGARCPAAPPDTNAEKRG